MQQVETSSLETCSSEGVISCVLQAVNSLIVKTNRLANTNACWPFDQLDQDQVTDLAQTNPLPHILLLPLASLLPFD